jgi:hypothetical protein
MNTKVQLGFYEIPVPMTLNEVNKLKDLGDHSTIEVTINNLAAFMTFAKCKKYCIYFTLPFSNKDTEEHERLTRLHCKECFEKQKAICTFLFDEYPENFIKELEKHSDVRIKM